MSILAPLRGIHGSQAIILAVIAIIILVIVVCAIIKSGGKGCAWIIGLIIAAIVAYFYISSHILK